MEAMEERERETENRKNKNTYFINNEFYCNGAMIYYDHANLFDILVNRGHEYTKIEYLQKSIEIIKSGEFKKGKLRHLLTKYYDADFMKDLYYLNYYDFVKTEIENKISKLKADFDNDEDPDKDERLYSHNRAIKYNQSQIEEINYIIKLANEFRSLLLDAIPDIETEFKRILEAHNDLQNKANDSLAEVVPMPTWADESGLETIFNELVSIEYIDKEDESNFYKAFGLSDDSVPYEKINIGKNQTELMAVLTLLVDRELTTLSSANKTIANDLFNLKISPKYKLKKQDFYRFVDKLPITNELRNAETQYYDDYEPPIA